MTLRYAVIYYFPITAYPETFRTESVSLLVVPRAIAIVPHQQCESVDCPAALSLNLNFIAVSGNGLQRRADGWSTRSGV